MKTLALGVLVALLAACTSPHPDAITQSGSHEVALYVTPGISGQNNDVRVEVRGGGRIPEITSVALSMPHAGTPAEQVALEEEGGGSYSAANVRFPKAGKWHVSVLERNGNATAEFAAFDVTVH